ncbi:unnamed protein product [Lymnaea stagnalis]|uniref:AIG1-type G domain-containing protein n=1 Tax=Lymnaea stagnalis TaxID=6523 RepID=A0AAV2HGD4_LYMST
MYSDKANEKEMEREKEGKIVPETEGESVSGKIRSLLLVGGPLHGKSTLGDKIISKKFFTEHGPSEKIEIKKEIGNGFEVTEYHGLLENIDEIDKIFNAAEDAVLKRFPVETQDYENFNKSKLLSIESRPDNKDEGFNALIFVIKYGIRLTKQEIQVMDMIKFVFGKDIFKDRGIIVFTFGENLTPDETIEDYIGKFKNEFKTLFGEKLTRFIMYNHKTTEIKRLNEELDDLLNDIKLERYTMKQFRAAALESYNKRLEGKYKKCEKCTDEFFFNVRKVLQDRDQTIIDWVKIKDAVNTIINFCKSEDMNTEFKKLLKKIQSKFERTKKEACEKQSELLPLLKSLHEPVEEYLSKRSTQCLPCKKK